MSKKAVLTEYTLSLSKIKKPFDLALVSDLHERRSDDILMLLKKAKPFYQNVLPEAVKI